MRVRSRLFAVFFISLLAWSSDRLVPALSAQRGERVDVLIAFHQQPGASEAALVRANGGTVRRSFHLVPAIAATLPAAALSGLQANPRVAAIELDGAFTAFDAELDNAWGVKRIGAGSVHAFDSGAGVKVAVIDTGVDYNHADLYLNYAGGYDFVNNDADPMDDNGHGTHVAGTIAALDNGVGVVGVAPQARIYALKVLDSSGSGSFSNMIAALQWAVDNGIQLTNNSYGSSSNPGVIVEDAFKNADAHGILSIAAAGNSGSVSGKNDSVGYPAKYASVVAVAATDSNNNRPSWSSTGSTVEITAPGASINSTKLGGGYIVYSGTSMATPHVVGTAALVLGACVGDTNANGRVNDEVRNILTGTALDIGASGRDTWFGFGLVQAAAAVNAALQSGGSCGGAPVSTSTSLQSSVNPSTFGSSVTFTATVTSSSSTPTGAMSFLDGGSSIGTVALNAAGQAAYSTAGLAVGPHEMTAIYNGGAGFTGSASDSLSQTVGVASTTTSLSSSTNPSVTGASVTFTATVAPSTATGSVQFFSEDGVIGTSSLSGGSAQLSISSLALGTHSIVATYGGDANFTGSTSATVTQAVNAAPSGSFSLSGSSPQSVVKGSAASFTITVAPVGGFTGNVTLAATGLPPQSSASFSVNPVLNGSGPSTLTITTGKTTPKKTYTITITGSGSGLSATTSVTLGVQ